MKRYCNPNIKRLLKNNKMYGKIDKSGKKFFIHDNGARPYLVYVRANNTVEIYKKSDNYFIFEPNDPNPRWAYIEHIKSFKPIQIWIPTGYYVDGCEKTKILNDKMFRGNTILLKLTNCKYIFIGMYICEFTIKNDEISEYYSLVGKNDVPYPVAIGKYNIYYITNEMYIPIKDIPKPFARKDKIDAHKYLYGIQENKSHPMTEVKIIQE